MMIASPPAPLPTGRGEVIGSLGRFFFFAGMAGLFVEFFVGLNDVFY
jgi:hypothetical protein